MTTTPSCAKHPEQASVASCDVCGQPLCELCRVEVVATGQVFCSERCSKQAQEGRAERKATSNETLRAGLKKPIRDGWALWARSAGRLVAAALPAAFVGGPLWWFTARSLDQGVPDVSGNLRGPILAVVFALFLAYSVALVGILLSQRHTGLLHDNPHARAARRLVPWLATWVLVIAITLAGYVALIIPGVYLALRLFWADEFALIHDKGPVAALKASWELTRKAAGPVFIFQFILGLAQYVIVLPALILLMVAVAGLAALGWTTMDRFSMAEAFLFLFVGLVAYGAMHAPEIVQFYGMRAARASLAADELERSDWLEREKLRPL